MSLTDNSSSIWDTIPPLQSHGRYVEHGKKELLTRVSHLPDSTSISFVLSLRGAPDRHGAASTHRLEEEDEEEELIDEISPDAAQATKGLGRCRNKHCVKVCDDLQIMMEKIKRHQELVDNLNITLMEFLEEERITTAQETKVRQEESNLEIELAKLKTKEKNGHFDEKIEQLRTEKIELMQKLNKASQTAKKLQFYRDHFMPDGTARTALRSVPRAAVKTPRHDELLPLKKKRGGKAQSDMIHTGTYRRLKETDWELAWTCCMKRGDRATGCVRRGRSAEDMSPASAMQSSRSVGAGILKRPGTASSTYYTTTTTAAAAATCTFSTSGSVMERNSGKSFGHYPNRFPPVSDREREMAAMRRSMDTTGGSTRIRPSTASGTVSVAAGVSRGTSATTTASRKVARLPLPQRY